MEPKLFKIVTISDIHFGSLDPAYTYEILQKQFLNSINNINFDICAICGDLFEAKYMSNNPIISYTLTFIDELIQICQSKNAALVLLDGTGSHDSGQLRLFYHYLSNPSIDIHIIENIQFEYIKGLRVLCIPERYGIPEEQYRKILFDSGYYDMCFLHGTFRGSFKGSDIATLRSTQAPIFSLASFTNCGGPILMGHYHISGCYEGYAYYNGSPLRWEHGQEQEKGFLITIYNKDTRYHYTQLIPIKSYSYITLNINDIISQDPKEIIKYVLHYKEMYNIDYIRLIFNNYNENMNVVKNYFRTNQYVTLEELKHQEKQLNEINKSIIEQNEQYAYVTDNKIDDYSKFVMYMNYNEGREFITVDEFLKFLEP